MILQRRLRTVVYVASVFGILLGAAVVSEPRLAATPLQCCDLDGGCGGGGKCVNTGELECWEDIFSYMGHCVPAH
jgi:hypothetical protein